MPDVSEECLAREATVDLTNIARPSPPRLEQESGCPWRCAEIRRASYAATVCAPMFHLCLPERTHAAPDQRAHHADRHGHGHRSTLATWAAAEERRSAFFTLRHRIELEQASQHHIRIVSAAVVPHDVLGHFCCAELRAFLQRA
eukprot:CAMPEP_0195569560 /NCGR_PEP_ID=MMETSP0814-20130614/2897_1 /TAXON_ID=97485 /ORGANISM="Prymnesium parvum, Strain Texoma1" /LENGTH=143 /DNA_ID=CAMNT_0040704953 /DNA_START=681 /DNA_END=1111 /DNA_ORIENTATION=+